jgi:hypothetical protein
MMPFEARDEIHRGREAARLSNGDFEAVVCRRGGMVPALGLRSQKSSVNAHWIPPFRVDSGAPYSEAEHGAFWKSKLLYEIAGDFLCSPTFGSGGTIDGAEIPAHGWTANEEWRLEGLSVDEESGAAWLRLSMVSPAPGMPLTWDRIDAVFAGQNALFSSLRVRNEGKDPISINVARHATVGPAFLREGCRISLCAERFATPPRESEFSATGRIAEGAEFSDLRAAPLRSGGTADLSLVPGLIGSTDLAAGVVPRGSALGWSCVLNPELGLAYLCLFPGPASLPEGEIALGFNVLWMQYGGRRFTPWAETEGGRDRTFCLGTESAVGAFANGLAYSRSVGELLGSPTTVVVPAGGALSLVYCTALLRLDKGLARENRLAAEIDGSGALALKSERAHMGFGVDASFGGIRTLARRLRGD